MLYEAISVLHPNARAGVDYHLRDDSDGNGPYIEHWGEAMIGAPRPTPDQIAAAFAAYVPPAPGDLVAAEIGESATLSAMVEAMAEATGKTKDQMLAAIKAKAK